MSKYYAVRKGMTPGIYKTWDETKRNVNGFKGAEYKSFTAMIDAQNYMNGIVSTKVESNTMVKSPKTIKNKDESNYDIVIYTDGSCINYVGGYGIVIIDHTVDDPNNVYEHCGHIPDKCTNQVAELYAIKEAIFLILEHKDKKILIKSDSMYSIHCLTNYIHKWKKNGFKTAKNEPIKNLNIILQIYEMLESFKCIEFDHVYSHVGVKWNERADVLANKGREISG